jgi:hypothetical protein
LDDLVEHDAIKKPTKSNAQYYTWCQPIQLTNSYRGVTGKDLTTFVEPPSDHVIGNLARNVAGGLTHLCRDFLRTLDHGVPGLSQPFVLSFCFWQSKADGRTDSDRRGTDHQRVAMEQPLEAALTRYDVSATRCPVRRAVADTRW